MLPLININDFNYTLPDERIAKYPLEERDTSKLLVFKNSVITEYLFKDIPSLIPSGNLMVFNNTKVIHARILFKRLTGSTIEVFLLEPIKPTDYALSFAAEGSCRWKCIVGNMKRWKEAALQMTIPDTPFVLSARRGKVNGDGIEIDFSWNGNLSFAQIIERCGRIPIPPYLNRNDEQVDKNRYQTVYAQPEGSVAAPTAGLHFTQDVLNRIRINNIETGFITLHVGAGTFKPVKSDLVNEHEMHSEHFFVFGELLDRIIDNYGKICSVGTTTLRTLESLYWLGVKLKTGLVVNNQLFLEQWEPYSLPSHYTVKESLSELKAWMLRNGLNQIEAQTQVCIVPGYQFKVVNQLITNFHQPKSTLMLLVSAFIGEKWKDVYNYALANQFRFLSYGDSSLLFRK